MMSKATLRQCCFRSSLFNRLGEVQALLANHPLSSPMPVLRHCAFLATGSYTEMFQASLGDAFLHHQTELGLSTVQTITTHIYDTRLDGLDVE